MALDPDKITLCWPNRVQELTLSGGSYLESRPLTLVQDRRLAVTCKTTNADNESTWFDALFPTARPISVIAIAAHNFSVTAQYRFRSYTDDEQTILLWDSGVQDVWPALYTPDQLEWEYDNFWSGTLTENDRDQYTALLTSFPEDVQITKSMRIEIFDSGNPAGSVQFGRVFVGDAWQPTYNAKYGIQHGLNNATEVEESYERTDYFDIRPQRRTVSLSLEHMNVSEAFQRIFGMHRTEGIQGEIIYAFSLRNQPESFVRTFLARQLQINPLTQPYYSSHSADINLLEIV